MNFSFALLLMVFDWIVQPAISANILVLSPITSYSHTHFFFYTVKALASRGHTVTYWNGLRAREDVERVTHLYSEELAKLNSKHEIGFAPNSPMDLMVSLPHRMETNCKICYNDPIFKKLRESKERFDLIIMEAFMNECMLPFVVQFDAPLIYMSPLPPLPCMLETTCSPMSIQEFPFLGLDYTNEMNLLQRTINIVHSVVVIYFRKWITLPKIDSLIRNQWNDTDAPLPNVKDIENRLSLYITNSNPIINYHYFKSPIIVEAGGLHLQQPKPLPQDVEEFVNGSGDAGFIVLSFGSIVHGSGMPEETRKIFVSAFSRLPQRVLWKWEDELGMKDLPPNVRLYTWLPPLIDLLAHPKIRLLMTHGGLYSNQETVWSGVPLIGFPIFGDQINYVVKAMKDGYAIKLDWMTLTEEILFDSIQEIINNPKYKENVQKLSGLMREQIEEDRPLDKVVRAIEYVIRHRGAPSHLRPGSCKLAMLQRESMDVMFILFLLTSLISYLIFRLFCSIIFVICGRKKTSRAKLKNQ